MTVISNMTCKGWWWPLICINPPPTVGKTAKINIVYSIMFLTSSYIIFQYHVQYWFLISCAKWLFNIMCNNYFALLLNFIMFDIIFNILCNITFLWLGICFFLDVSYFYGHSIVHWCFVYLLLYWVLFLCCNFLRNLWCKTFLWD